MGPGSQAVGPPEVAGEGGGGVDVQRGFVELAVATATGYPLRMGDFYNCLLP